MKNALLANEKKVQRQQITFDDLSEELSLLSLQYGAECYKIIQSFPKHGRISYILRGLECEIEQGFVCFSDYDEILLENNITHALLMFMKNSVKNLYKLKAEDDNDDPDYYKIEFKDEYNGFIEIHPLL
jgi:hypothetical protein